MILTYTYHAVLLVKIGTENRRGTDKRILGCSYAERATAPLPRGPTPLKLPSQKRPLLQRMIHGLQCHDIVIIPHTLRAARSEHAIVISPR